MKRSLIGFLLIIFIAQSVQALSFRKYAGEFLTLGAGSRALGMAGAFTAVANDVTAGYWNPAGLIGADGLQIQFMHSKQFLSSIQYNYLAASSPMDDQSTLGVSFLYLTVNNIKDSRDAWNEAEQKVDPSKVTLFNTGDYSFLFSYARRFDDRLSWGVNVKMMYRDYKVDQALGLGFDAGLRYRPLENLYLGLMINDLTSTLIAWNDHPKELIKPSARLGVTYKLLIPSVDLRIQPAVDIKFYGENRQYSSQVNVGWLSADFFSGVELAYNEIIALRVGLDDLNRFNTGIGVQIPRIRFDYSFTSYQSELGDIHRISFHLQFDGIL